MNKIILVEGPDGSGKSTLCLDIMNRYKASYIHSSRPKNKNDIHGQFIHNMSAAHLIKETGCDVILDRHFLSQIVYQGVFEDQGTIERFSATAFINSIDKIVLCIPSNKEKYLERFNKLKSDRYELYQNMEDVYEGYLSLYTGIKTCDKINNEFYDMIINGGGLKNNNKVVLYDMDKVNKDDINKFVDENVYNI